MTAIRIVVVDDHALIRPGFSAILESESGFEVVGEAANGAEAVELVTELVPDVVCMDVQMPVMDGICTSMHTTSGTSSVTSSTASAPMAASPTTSNPGSDSKIAENPCRIKGWSSTRTMRIAVI